MFGGKVSRHTEGMLKTYSFSESGELLGLAPAEDVEAVDEGGE